MRKMLKVILIIIAVIVVATLIGIGLCFSDVAAYTATGSKTLSPSGSSVGKAIVVYDPGLSGASHSIAEKIAGDLKAKGYTVNLAGIKSRAAANTSGYSVIVVGGPIYGGKPTGSVNGFLSKLNPVQGTKVGVFGSGSFSVSSDKVVLLPNNSTLIITYSTKILSSEVQSVRCQEFVNQLLK
jgi:menaquinone-dependent protoporphyrinogen IX oxidase